MGRGGGLRNPPGHDADAVSLEEDGVLLSLHLDVRHAQTELAVQNGVALLERQVVVLTLADRDDVTWQRERGEGGRSESVRARRAQVGGIPRGETRSALT